VDSPNEVDRLRALFALMREAGVASLDVGPSEALPAVRVVLGAAPPEQRARPRTDEQRALTEEDRVARQLDDAERQHREYWQRVTRSSGAPIPPYKPRRPS
jgi:hypothetical protein